MKPEIDDPKNPDMSPEAIDARFRMVEALRKLCISLRETGDAARRAAQSLGHTNASSQETTRCDAIPESPHSPS